MQNNRRNQRHDRRGLTMVEIMVVLIILVAIGGMAVMTFVAQRQTALERTARVNINALETAIRLFDVDIGRPPTTEEGLEALVTQPSTLPNPDAWAGYLDDRRGLTDPWGNPYRYESPVRSIPEAQGRRYAIWSVGADGQSIIGSWMAGQ